MSRQKLQHYLAITVPVSNYETSRELPKSAPYLRLKIEKGGPFGLCETPAGCKK